jgi:hypothetical protein
VTEPTPDREALDTAKGLTDAVKGLREDVKGLRRYGKRNRWFIAVDVALTIVLAAVTVIAIHASSDASSATASASSARAAAAVAARDNRALCLSGNAARKAQIEPWEILISLSTPPKSAKQKHLIDLFIDKLHQIYAPRNCSHITAGNP